MLRVIFGQGADEGPAVMTQTCFIMKSPFRVEPDIHSRKDEMENGILIQFIKNFIAGFPECFG